MTRRTPPSTGVRQTKPAPRAVTPPVRAASKRVVFEPDRTGAFPSVQTLAATLPAESSAAALRAALALLVLVVASGSLLVTARARVER